MSDPSNLYSRFRKFYLLNYGKLLNYAASQASAHHPAEDLLQDAMERAWEQLCRDDSKHEYNWYNWIHSLIKWIAMDEARRRRDGPVVLANDSTSDDDKDLIADAIDDSPSPAELAILGELGEIMKEALSRMKNKRERQLLELFYYDSANHPNLLEVAKTLGVQASSIRKIHQRAKESLKAILRIIAPDLNISPDKPDHES